MTIQYSQPLSHAWLRMKALLFRPFDIAFWFVLGFASFMATLGESFGGGMGRISQSFNDDFGDFQNFNFENITDGFTDAASNLADTSLGMLLIVILSSVALVVFVVLMWISSRGIFVFLDNLVHKRSKIVQPWTDLAAQGDSLFLWSIFYNIAVLMVMGMGTVMALFLFIPLFASDVSWLISVPLVMLGGTLLFMLVVSLAFLEFFLIAFVVPIMHKERITILPAWSRFLVLFRKHPGSFCAFGLFYLVISILAWMAMTALGVATCCVGLVLMGIPFLGSVITLPVNVTMRYFSLEFLGQFGPDYQLLGPMDADFDQSTNNNEPTQETRSENLIETRNTDEDIEE
ncbi:MAG: hypothetical protein GY780_11060 [bacterium]|nr:hypothetical protein [bacterium]